MSQAIPTLLLEMHEGITDIRETLRNDVERVEAAANAARLAQLELVIERALHILSDRHENHAVRVHKCQKLLKAATQRVKNSNDEIPF